MFYVLLLVAFAFGLTYPKVLIAFYSKCLPIISSKRFLFISRICLGFLAVIFLFSLTDPAHAQFYGSTEKWLIVRFSVGSRNAANPEATNIGLAIALIFNVLRALFVIYLGIALVRVIVAARNDDDWQQLARIPLILVLAVTLGDQLAGIITGPGT